MKMNKCKSIRRQMNSAIGVFLCLLLLLTCQTATALAENPTMIDGKATGSIHLSYPIPYVNFDIYLVGHSDHNNGYILDAPFDSYQVNLTSSDAARTLADYVTFDGIAPLRTEMSNKNGDLTVKGLEQGVYLLIGQTAFYEGKTYVSDPVMLELPGWNSEGELIWNRDVEGKPGSVSPIQYTSLKVLKVWKNDDEEIRPAQIKVQLLKDGLYVSEEEVPDREVVLNAENNWTYTWFELDGNSVWSVNEKSVPEGYVVNKSKEGEEIVLTNTYTPSEEILPADDNPGGKNPGHSRLPRTGQHWLPVLFMTVAGLFLILIGLLWRGDHHYT